jgi:Zn ribbon nucleic-acid-binding protein
MAQNPIQIQPGLSLSEFMTKYGTETQCAAALEQSRWPEGFVCARCASARHSMWRRESRSYRQCSHCGYQTSLTAGTIFEATKLPLRLWFLAMHLLSQAKNNVSALELKRHLAVSYPTAFMLKHKLMQVMTQREQARRLDGRVEIDDAYLGGERPGKRGRGSENKIPFIAAVQTNHQGHPLFVRLDRLSTFSHQRSRRGRAKRWQPRRTCSPTGGRALPWWPSTWPSTSRSLSALALGRFNDRSFGG